MEEESLKTPTESTESIREGTLAIDLGNSTTIVVFQGERDKEPELLTPFPLCKSAGEIPSLVWHSITDAPYLLIGEEVNQSNIFKQDDNNLSSDFKRWIGSKEISASYKSNLSPEKAGELLIQKVWDKVTSKFKIKRLVLTAPVETYRAYRKWLLTVCRSLDVNEIALVDEPTAAAMGAGLPPGSKLLVIDIGGSTIDMSIVEIEGGEGKAGPIAQLVRFEGQSMEERSKQVLRCAKVLGKAGQRIGGRDIDRWIANYLFPNLPVQENLLNAAEKLKCKLSEENLKESKVISEEYFRIEGAASEQLRLSKAQFEKLLENKGLIITLTKLLEQTLDSSKRNNFELKDLDSVVLVGGGAQIPIIKECIKKLTSPTPLLTPPPVEAIAIGAIRLTPGVTIKDVLNKGVSLRLWDKRTTSHKWHPLFLSGQPWPTSQPLEIILSASKKNQSAIEIAIGEPDYMSGNEIIYIDGVPTIKSLSTKRKVTLLEEGKQLIKVNPPAQPGEDCLKLKFSINNNCELILEGIDLRNGNQIEYKLVGSIR